MELPPTPSELAPSTPAAITARMIANLTAAGSLGHADPWAPFGAAAADLGAWVLRGVHRLTALPPLDVPLALVMDRLKCAHVAHGACAAARSRNACASRPPRGDAPPTQTRPRHARTHTVPSSRWGCTLS